MNAGAQASSGRVRAPREHGGTIIEPPRAAAEALIARNGGLRSSSRADILGQPLVELAKVARVELLQAAFESTRQYRDVPAPPQHGPLLMAGHQPQLFHAGVWFKNFVLGGLAQRQGGVGINLVIDSDTLRSPAIRVPGATIEQPTAHALAFDAPGPQIPFEERTLLDRATFASFGDRVAAEIAPLVAQPLVRNFWPLVLQQGRSTDNLGACLAQARHALEGQWGLNTLELPQSHVCQMPSFYRFALHLIAELPRLHEIYNRSLAEYRDIHGVRSKNHPAPDLAGDDDALEAPLWMWSQADPRRRRVFVHRRRDGFVLTDRAGTDIDLPWTSSGDPHRAMEVLAMLPQRRIKLRTRALITTLWARLALTDLFLHGIGGAKYDQLTDRIMAQFFQVPAPAFLTVTATLRLPIVHERVSQADLRSIDHQWRDLEFHPEAWLQRHPEDIPTEQRPAVVRCVQEKARWVATPQTRNNARQRCRAIREANAALGRWTMRRREQLRVELQHMERQERASALLGSREFAFCLFPEKTLRDFLLEFHSPESYSKAT